MTRYRALIVDDSKSARHSLARLLQAHDLDVEFAASGEEALDFLKDHLVDVIFMDHSMPGMDGLEAVSAIKSNPRTATIPVMMYTAKEGEVYVGQARALGAVGVLPKQVQPGVLFDMLQKLGLVVDRRAPDKLPEPDAPRRRFTDLVDDVDREYEQRALGASVQALITRMLDAHHQQFRADLQSSQRRFARQVAAEVLARYAPPETGEPAPAAQARPRPRLLPVAALLLIAGLAGLGAAHWQLRVQHEEALAALAQQHSHTHGELTELTQLHGALAARVVSQRRDNAALQSAAARAFSWALNQDPRIDWEDPPFNASLADRLPDLLKHLQSLEFRGQVVLTAHLGRFCLVSDAYGRWQPAAGDLPITACEHIGHPLDGAVSTADLQTVEFADALQAADADGAGLRVELRSAESPADWIQGTHLRAAEWNAEAALANRIEVELIPEATPADIARRP